MNNDNYVKTIYSSTSRPITSYPAQLVKYIIDRFNIGKGSIIVDSGCGRGDFAQAFYDAGMDVIGIDGTVSEFDTCFHKIGGIDLETDILPIDDNSVDIVFSKSVLEHIHKPDIYISEIKRILKPEGLFIVMVPDWQSQMWIFYDDFSHVQPYTVKGIFDTLKIYGFNDVFAEKFYQLPSVWKNPTIKIFCRFLQFVGGPVKTISKNKFYRFSRELMILGGGKK